MHITVEHFNTAKPQFNVSIASKEGREPFLVVKGCRIVDGSNGRFVSWPATKKDDGKYWNHCWASEPFAAAVLAEAEKSAPREPAKQQAKPNPQRSENVPSHFDDDIPF